VAIGSWARKIIREFIKRDDFDDNLANLKEAVAGADALMRANVEALSG